MLAVVLLNHLPETHSGNFTVWPKSYAFFENYFRENGIEVLANGMPPVDLLEDPIVHTVAPNIRYAPVASPTGVIHQ